MASTPTTTPINTAWKCDQGSGRRCNGGLGSRHRDDTRNDVVFTEDEIEDNDALTVLAKADGDQQSVDLYLEETGRFSGQYVGFVSLTDANGDGSVKGPWADPTDETAPTTGVA